MIVCVCYTVTTVTGQREPRISHGIDFDTGQTCILPALHPAQAGAAYSQQLDEWVLLEPGEEPVDLA